MSIVARVSVPSKRIFELVEVDTNPTVQGAIDQLDLHDIDWNGTATEIRVNGALVERDHQLNDKDSVLILPDKPTGNSTVARVSVPSKRIFELVEVDTNPTVQGAIDQLDLHDIDWNGTATEIRVNGALVTRDHPLNDKDSVLILPDKPTGN